MSTSGAPVVLGITEDRDAQPAIAKAFNELGVFYRFISDRQKVRGGLASLKPSLLVIFGELASDFVIQVLDTLSSDVDSARLPVVVVAADVRDAPFVAGFRSGVVALLPSPFSEQHVEAVRGLWHELPSRPGGGAGLSDTATLARLVDHLRRTRRSGVLVIDPRTPNEGRASFIYGRLGGANYLGAHGANALEAMLRAPRARWTFTEVASAQSEGASVVIEVGESITGETPVGEVVELTSSLTPAPLSTGPSRILLVDDDAAILTMFSRLFAKHGFDVSTAADGAQGLELAAAQPFDVVLADLNMPHLDGWGMLRALRDDYRESLRALDAGAQAYLSKGTKLDAIVTQVIKLLEPRRALQAALELKQTTELPIHSVGPQWLLTELARRRETGVLTARDNWATYTLGFAGGTCTHASGVAGKYQADGERAFNAFVASRAATGDFVEGPGPAANLQGSTASLVARAQQVLNENEQRLRDTQLLTATQILVNDALYQVYRAVGPRDWLEVARLFCEEKATPREVIARVALSPVEIEACLKDLLRRGVVTLPAA